MSDLTKEERDALRVAASSLQFLATMKRLQMVRDLMQRDKNLTTKQAVKKLFKQVEGIAQALGELNAKDKDFQKAKQEKQDEAIREREQQAINKSKKLVIPVGDRIPEALRNKV